MIVWHPLLFQYIHLFDVDPLALCCIKACTIAAPQGLDERLEGRLVFEKSRATKKVGIPFGERNLAPNPHA